GRRPPHRLARARSITPTDARSDSRPQPPRQGLRRSLRTAIPMARVRRRKPPPPVEAARTGNPRRAEGARGKRAGTGGGVGGSLGGGWGPAERKRSRTATGEVPARPSTTAEGELPARPSTHDETCSYRYCQRFSGADPAACKMHCTSK